MDQYIISLGQRDHALLIDCRSLDYQLVAIPSGYRVIICDTQKRRGLVDSEYNTRRRECETGASILGVKALRDVSPEQLEAYRAQLAEVTYRRCKHIVTEDVRVLEAVSALERDDVAAFGQLMNASHVSLRDDYQVSCRELDIMVEIAWQQPGVAGARMTGAGFGGCAVALVEAEQANAFRRNISRAYGQDTGLLPEIHICAAEDGVRSLDGR
jgi:galactokinase